MCDIRLSNSDNANGEERPDQIIGWALESGYRFNLQLVYPNESDTLWPLISGCPFCDPPAESILYEGELVIAIWDGYPVSRGHALIVPKRHVADWFSATLAEQAELTAAVSKAREVIEAEYQPDGYNVGFNCGEAAGQTVFHLHLHVIPRYSGDVTDPRGGVRFVVPSKARY